MCTGVCMSNKRERNIQVTSTSLTSHENAQTSHIPKRTQSYDYVIPNKRNERDKSIIK